jgi:hypothetical protein
MTVEAYLTDQAEELCKRVASAGEEAADRLRAAWDEERKALETERTEARGSADAADGASAAAGARAVPL